MLRMTRLIIENIGNTENIWNIKNIRNIENVGKIKNIRNIENIGNTPFRCSVVPLFLCPATYLSEFREFKEFSVVWLTPL